MTADLTSFYWAVVKQLPPQHRPIFQQRVVAILQAHPDPGPGDVNRAIRAALHGLLPPPPDVERPSRWDRDAPRFERASKRAY